MTGVPSSTPPDSVPVSTGGELRQLSPGAKDWIERLGAVTSALRASPRHESDVVTRPHPLLLMVRQRAGFVLIAPALLWDRGRDLLVPYVEDLARTRARLLLLGKPEHSDLELALNHGVTALLSPEPSIDELTVALHNAFEPTVLAAGDFERIEELGRQTYARLDGSLDTLLRPEEVRSLSIPRGSLTREEFDEIQSHVSHTYRFLSQIPWGATFSRVALIAGAHHERLDGTGYPRRLRAEEIPLQSKIMSISDIFDALTASDRPYKRAVPIQKALDILALEVKDHHIDGDLVRIFIASRGWESVVQSQR